MVLVSALEGGENRDKNKDLSGSRRQPAVQDRSESNLDKEPRPTNCRDQSNEDDLFRATVSSRGRNL